MNKTEQCLAGTLLSYFMVANVSLQCEWVTIEMETSLVIPVKITWHQPFSNLLLKKKTSGVQH